MTFHRVIEFDNIINVNKWLRLNNVTIHSISRTTNPIRYFIWFEQHRRKEDSEK